MSSDSQVEPFDQAMYCVSHGLLGDLRTVVKRSGLDVNVHDSTLIRTASYIGYVEVMRDLLSYGATIDSCKDQLVLDMARDGQLVMMEVLEYYGADLHHTNDLPLVIAATNLYYGAVKFLYNGASQEGKDAPLEAISKLPPTDYGAKVARRIVKMGGRYGPSTNQEPPQSEVPAITAF